MTAETDLLPLPEYFRRDLSQMTWEGLSQAAINYASANVASAVAPLQAEVEALRAEVEGLTQEVGRLQQQYDERTACVIVHRGSALACSDDVRAAYFDERRRAERLAELLDQAYGYVPAGALADQIHCALLRFALTIADAALSKENSND